MRKKLFNICMMLMACSLLGAQPRTYKMSDFGIIPNSSANLSKRLQKAISKIRKESGNNPVTLSFEKGKYNFHPKGASLREYYISNHDQDNPKAVAFALEDFHNLTIDGNGAEFIFHGIMLPVSVVNSSACTLKNFSIDFVNPTILQAQVLQNDHDGTIIQTASWTKSRINADNKLEAYGEGWSLVPEWGIAFEEKTKRVVYNTSDIHIEMSGIKYLQDNKYLLPEWHDAKMIPGTVIAMRNFQRPTPGIFISGSKDTSVQNVVVHYAFGMGLLAQMSENILLDHFGVCLKGDADKRYFTTQADATHFSGCKGKIISTHGLYEGMMDDAINVHGTYLKVLSQADSRTIIAKYMHGQTWGFDWGFAGDTVQFVRSGVMEEDDGKYIIAHIEPYDKDETHGAKEFKITFDREVKDINLDNAAYGIENLTWTPEVYFANNTIRNNRARGSLFSTPRKTIVEHNIFDHTSGAAILLCGDCNGWFETGSCKDVLISDNKFINALTNMFQFTNAVISIYPEIPHLEKQTKYFHGGTKGAITIENNHFITFDAPLLYAKSVDGLIYRNNIVETNHDYPALHWNRNRYLLERVNRVEIE